MAKNSVFAKNMYRHSQIIPLYAMEHARREANAVLFPRDYVYRFVRYARTYM